MVLQLQLLPHCFLPSENTSHFQIGASCLMRSMMWRLAWYASFLCAEDVITTTALSPTATFPIRCCAIARFKFHFTMASSRISLIIFEARELCASYSR